MARRCRWLSTFTGHCYCAGGDGYRAAVYAYPSWRAAATQPAEALRYE